MKELQTGDVLHCKGKSLLSKLILKFSKGQFSHTAIVVKIWEQTYVVGAQKNGVNPRLYSEWVKEFGYEYKVSRPIYLGFKEEFIAKRIFSKVGVTKYDFKSLIIYQPIHLLTGKWLGKDSNATNRFYCSEFVAWVYNFWEWEELTPQALYDITKDSKDFKTFD